LDTLEEVVVVCFSGCSFLVRMMTEDLLSVGLLDLLVGGFVAIFRQTEDGIVILSLK
jgi:hypothetical protein